MAYRSNALGQENALSYPFPKWHPYYGWGFGGGHQGYQPTMNGYPGQTPPGNWFGRPVVGDAGDRAGPVDFPPSPGPQQPPELIALSAAGGAGIGYLITKTALGAIVGGGVGALAILTSTYVFAQLKKVVGP